MNIKEGGDMQNHANGNNLKNPCKGKSGNKLWIKTRKKIRNEVLRKLSP
jgi:hypothetical protein